MSAPALELRDITRRFGDVVALAGAKLIVERGSIHALLGENGAGKSTLMRVAYGLIRPDAGEIRIDGTTRTLSSPADGIDAGVGMVQQHPANVGAMTVWENVVLGGKGLISRAKVRGDVRRLIASLGFKLDADARVSELPVASQQRLEILKAVYRRARLLILDEPTAILAPEEARELYVWLRGFADGGGTAVVVTHKLVEARDYADDLTVLRGGRTVLQSRADISSEQLTQAMIGEGFRPSTRPVADPNAYDHPPSLVLRASNVSLVDERGARVIQDASFEVRWGEIVGVAGVEGSGHHELLLAIAGRLVPATGVIEPHGSVSLIPEDRHRNAVVSSFTLEENALIKDAGSRRGRIPWPETAQRVRHFIKQYDVRAPGPTATMGALSGGNQQKFVIAREMSSYPELVVAENPTRGLDIRASAFVRDELRFAANGHGAVVVYSSDLDEILDLADRVLVVYAGKVTEVPLDRARIGAAMLGAA